MQTIDLTTWPRAAHFQFFRRMDYPQYMICANIDVTHFLAATKARKLSFYYAMIYAATDAINQVEAFRYRIHGELVVLFDRLHPSFTDMEKGSQMFKMVTVDMEDDIETFTAKAAQKSLNQKDYFAFQDVEGRDDLIYITCIPWISFTSLSHTISLNKDDCVPRVSWGKYFKDGEKVLLPFSVQAHHSFVDGLHMGQYFDGLQKWMDTF